MACAPRHPMNKFTELLIIIFIVLLPLGSLLYPEQSLSQDVYTFSVNWQFTVFQAILSCFFIYRAQSLFRTTFFSKNSCTENNKKATLGDTTNSGFFHKGLWAFLALIALLQLSYGLNLGAKKLGHPAINVILPPLNLSLVISLAIAALWEEVLYRWYGPLVFYHVYNALYKHTKDKKPWQKVLVLFTEIFFCLIFALAHLHEGIPGTVNAFVSALILRYTVYKTSSFIPGFIAHYAYNLIQFALL